MTLEALLSDRKPRTAMEIARLTEKPIEEVYERLVSLEGRGIAELTINDHSRKHGYVEKLWSLK
jgi:sugar-specific transcriptional regulator TrmB